MNHTLDSSVSPLTRSELFHDMSPTVLQPIIHSQRSDILFFFGVCIGLTCYHQVIYIQFFYS